MTNGELIQFLKDHNPEEHTLIDGRGFFPCPRCKTLCFEPAPHEMGSMANRGWYCSVECKVAYIGVAP